MGGGGREKIRKIGKRRFSTHRVFIQTLSTEFYAMLSFKRLETD